MIPEPLYAAPDSALQKHLETAYETAICKKASTFPESQQAIQDLTEAATSPEERFQEVRPLACKLLAKAASRGNYFALITLEDFIAKAKGIQKQANQNPFFRYEFQDFFNAEGYLIPELPAYWYNKVIHQSYHDPEYPQDDPQASQIREWQARLYEAYDVMIHPDMRSSPQSVPAVKILENAILHPEVKAVQPLASVLLEEAALRGSRFAIYTVHEFVRSVQFLSKQIGCSFFAYALQDAFGPNDRLRPEVLAHWNDKALNQEYVPLLWEKFDEAKKQKNFSDMIFWSEKIFQQSLDIPLDYRRFYCFSYGNKLGAAVDMIKLYGYGSKLLYECPGIRQDLAKFLQILQQLPDWIGQAADAGFINWLSCPSEAISWLYPLIEYYATGKICSNAPQTTEPDLHKAEAVFCHLGRYCFFHSSCVETLKTCSLTTEDMERLIIAYYREGIINLQDSLCLEDLEHRLLNKTLPVTGPVLMELFRLCMTSPISLLRWRVSEHDAKKQVGNALNAMLFETE